MFPIYLLSTPQAEIFNLNMKNSLILRNIEVEGEVCGVGFAFYGCN